MAKYLLLLAALMCAGVANADNSKAHEPVKVDSDGFKEPLTKLKFNPGLDQREFERSSLTALNVYDPLESWNRRVYHFNYRFDQWVFLPVVNGYTYVTPSPTRETDIPATMPTRMGRSTWATMRLNSVC